MKTGAKGAVLIVGGLSDIGLAIAHRYAQAGHDVQLAARDAKRLAPDRADLELRYGVTVTAHELDILHPEQFESFTKSLPVLPAVMVCVVGAMGEQAESERNPAAAMLVMRSNYEGPALLTGVFAQAFATRGWGTIIGIGSVAGDRGRSSNYVYGSAKAGYAAYLSGLRGRMARVGVHVMTVLPGFVATRMTQGLDLPVKLTAQPQAVGEAVYQAAQKKKNVIYVKPVWRLIMLIIKSLPEFIFKKTKF